MKKILISLIMLLSISSVKAYDEELGYWTHVHSAQNLKEVLQHSAANNGRKSWESIRLSSDIYLCEIGGGGFGDFLDAFCGILDGNGHTIYGSGDGIYSCKPLFSNTDGARFRNVKFKNIRVNSDDDPNMAVIARNAKNGQFTEVTMDNVHTWSDYDYVGTLAAYAENCMFKDVIITHSDCTTDAGFVGCVVGNSKNCTYSNVVVDDLCCADADGSGTGYGYVGGIMGRSEGDQISDCINSAIVIGDGSFIGGLAGAALESTFTRCLNTGMVLSAPQRNAPELHDKYANKRFTCETKYYNGKEYAIRIDNETHAGWFDPEYTVGGIVGTLTRGELGYCTNFGFLNSTKHTGDAGGCGGLVAQLNAWHSYIHDCLTDFKYYAGKDNFIYGFVGAVVGAYAEISNCVSTSKDQLVFADGYSNTKDLLPCYSFRQNSSCPQKEITVTEDDLNFGRVFSLLGTGWEQNLGSDRTPVPSGDKGIYHERTVSNEYGTLCLPFSVYSDNEIRYYTFKEATTDDGEVNLMFEYAYQVPAGTPVLFRVAEAGNVMIYRWFDDELAIGPVHPSASADWNIYGTFGQQVFEGDQAKNIYYISGGKIKNAQKATIGPCRAYFVGPSIDDLKGGSYARVHIMVDGEEASSLQFVVDDLVPGQIGKAYTLHGIEAGDHYHGIVVRDGKKVMR